jgi:ketosteroid isomerase-like protein
MKQLLFIILTAAVFSVIACNSGSNTSVTGKTDDAGQNNLLAANAINKAIETGDVSGLGDYIASDAVDHSGDHGEVKGLDSIKAELSSVHKLATNDFKIEVIRELADSEYVFQWQRVTGTAADAKMGVPAGSKFDQTFVDISKFKNGKATDHWEFMKMMAPQQKK